MVPPKIIAGTNPMRLAAKPLSKAPNSLELLTKMLFTEETRPLRFSGVLYCKILWRITMETASKAPPNIRMKNDKYTFFDSPKQMMHTPNKATLVKSFGPTLLFKRGSEERKNIMTSEPIPCAERNHPNSNEPAFKTFSVTAGRRDSAPPKNTANMSKLKTARIIGVAKMNLNPSFMRCIGVSSGSGTSVTGFGEIRNTINNDIHIKVSAVPKAASIPKAANITPPAKGPKTEPIINADELNGMAF